MSKDLNINAAICQINPTLGDFENNFKKILDFYQKSLNQNADLVIFPEMSTTGYPPQDLLFSEKFIQKNLKVLNEFSKNSILDFSGSLLSKILSRSSSIDFENS